MTHASNVRDLSLVRSAKLKTFASNNELQTIGAAKITVKEGIFALWGGVSSCAGRAYALHGEEGRSFFKPRSGGFPEGLLDRAFCARVRTQRISQARFNGLKLSVSLW
jgi:hypothetical protein